MLQQTTVSAVIPYFDRFVSRFPDLQTLADSEQADVMRLWEGLGYYSRARNLHKAAQMIVGHFNGQFPADVQQLQLLPGVGRYTAGAIASFAFQLPAPIVEANTARLYARIIGLREPVHSSVGQRALWNFAEEIVGGNGLTKHAAAAEFNQALMDLGSSICRPAGPNCISCPLTPFCKAYNLGQQQQIPVTRPRPIFTELTEVSIAIQKNQRWLLRQCGEGERWTGLWDFMRFEVEPHDLQLPGVNETLTDSLKAAKAERTPQTRQRSLFPTGPETPQFKMPDHWFRTAESKTGLQFDSPEFVKRMRHTVTRYHIQLLCVRMKATHGRILPSSGFKWFTERQIADLPLSTTARQLARIICRGELKRPKGN